LCGNTLSVHGIRPPTSVWRLPLAREQPYKTERIEGVIPEGGGLVSYQTTQHDQFDVTVIVPQRTKASSTFHDKMSLSEAILLKI